MLHTKKTCNLPAQLRKRSNSTTFPQTTKKLEKQKKSKFGCDSTYFHLLERIAILLSVREHMSQLVIGLKIVLKLSLRKRKNSVKTYLKNLAGTTHISQKMESSSQRQKRLDDSRSQCLLRQVKRPKFCLISRTHRKVI